MRRSVIALIVSLFLLGGGLYILKSEDSNSTLSMKGEPPSTSSQEKIQEPKQTTPASSNCSPDQTPPDQTPPDQTTSNQTTATSSTSSKGSTTKVNVPSQDLVSTVPEKSNPDPVTPVPQPSTSSKTTEPQKPVVAVTPKEGNQGIITSVKGLSPLFYKGLQIDVVGVKVKVQAGIL